MGTIHSLPKKKTLKSTNSDDIKNFGKNSIYVTPYAVKKKKCYSVFYRMPPIKPRKSRYHKASEGMILYHKSPITRRRLAIGDTWLIFIGGCELFVFRWCFTFLAVYHPNDQFPTGSSVRY